MINSIFHTLQVLSTLHIVPHKSLDIVQKRVLERIISPLPYFITDTGNVFIGAQSFESIYQDSLCLQAHLDHPGGVLKLSDTCDYGYCKYYGHTKARLAGHTVGCYLPGHTFPFATMEVEHICNTHTNEIILYFKDIHHNIVDQQAPIIVHAPFVPGIHENSITSWNLDDLLNVSIIIEYLKHNGTNQWCYGLLTLSEETGHSSLNSALDQLYDKNLFYVNMDCISDTIKTNHDFGIRKCQTEVKLDSCIPRQLCDSEYCAEIPYGQCEGMTITAHKQKNISLFIKIQNFHNNVFRKKYEAESVTVETLGKYYTFVENTITELLQTVSHTVTTAEPLQKKPSLLHYPKLSCSVIDHCTELRELLTELDTFSDYLTVGIKKISTIFSRYGLDVPALSRDSFTTVKSIIASQHYPQITISFVEDIVVFLLDSLQGILQVSRDYFYRKISSIEIATLVLGNFNACNQTTPCHRILLSLEKIPLDDYQRIITHELTHYLMNYYWSRIPIDNIYRVYYDEGLAVYLSAKYTSASLAKSLTLSENDFQRYTEHIEKLKCWFYDYAHGNHYRLFKGTYHEYFINKKICNPFLASKTEFSRYGYFLAALETAELIEEGVFNEKILCQPLS